eukprot:CAMPEP_0172893808 /NCGR_PEP_ID=MMETSP1075-20121228/149405_1 /TAXON_ID=2916 /ORGANISM="Ceratium fusus, Strain PA161109" /LENGTH=65 /DNA_ID=CAMNT_0013748727 /DNA_START=24 /DNA_END=221 /DNA_ORIENTATION=+
MHADHGHQASPFFWVSASGLLLYLIAAGVHVVIGGSGPSSESSEATPAPDSDRIRTQATKVAQTI